MSTANLKVKATPKKRKATKKANDGGEAEESPTKKKKPIVCTDLKARLTTTDHLHAAKGIPDRYEDLSEEDKMMITWKEVCLILDVLYRAQY